MSLILKLVAFFNKKNNGSKLPISETSGFLTLQQKRSGVQPGNRAKLLHPAGCVSPFASVGLHITYFYQINPSKMLTRGRLRTATTLCVDSGRRSFASFRQHQLFPQSHVLDLYTAVGKECKLFLNSVGCTRHRLWSRLHNLYTSS